MTQLLDGHVYMLPDDTEVLVVEVEPGRFRLDSATDEQLYVQSKGGAFAVWCRLTWNYDEGYYNLGACDLTNDDLSPVEGQHDATH